MTWGGNFKNLEEVSKNIGYNCISIENYALNGNFIGGDWKQVFSVPAKNKYGLFLLCAQVNFLSSNLTNSLSIGAKISIKDTNNLLAGETKVKPVGVTANMRFNIMYPAYSLGILNATSIYLYSNYSSEIAYDGWYKIISFNK